jgi:large subunit ribosomal protein L44e
MSIVRSVRNTQLIPYQSTRREKSAHWPLVLRHELEKHGYGGQKWPELKRTAKTTKKQVLRLKCRTCGFEVARLGIRLRKLEIGA